MRSFAQRPPRSWPRPPSLPREGGKGGRALALVVIAGLGAFAASRFVDGGAEPSALRPVASSSMGDAGAAAGSFASVDATAATLPLAIDRPLDAAAATSDANVEADASDASAEAGADASTPAQRPLPLDDFNDPWAKPPATK